MIFDPKYKIEKAVSKDVTRGHIAQAHYNLDKKRVEATDGHILVAVPCSVEPGDRGGHIPVRAFVEGRTLARKRPARLRVGKKLVDVCGQVILRRTDGGSFPPIDQVIPAGRPGDRGTVTVCFNPRLLMSLSEAIGAELVVMTFKPTAAGLEPIYVTGTADKEAFGVLMPARR